MDEGARYQATGLARQSILGAGLVDGMDLRRGILDPCRQLAAMLGTTPDVSFSGAVDALCRG